MNILQLLPSLDIGGVETGTIDLARYLASKGHRVIVVSQGGRLVRELDKIGARHYSLPVGKKSLFTILRMIWSLAEIIRREDIDIVHARSRVPALIGYFACRRTGRVFITTAHGYYSKHPLSVPMSWGRFVIVASNIMAKHMTNDFGLPHGRIRLIPRGVDLENFKFRNPKDGKEGGFTVGMVSRITPLKGHADFIKAVSILNRQIPGLKAVIAGAPPKAKYLEDLELLVRRLGLDNTVEFLGPKEDVPAVMAGLDVLVSATVTPEAFGRAIVEAQASGVNVVATKVGGVVDIVEDEHTGLLSLPQDPKGMADKILRLYRNRPFAAAIAVEARRSVEANFNLNAMTEKTLALYEEALRVKNILVMKMSAAGDVILSVPSLRAIRARYPDGNIKVLVGVEYREILDRCPYINDRIVCDFKGKDKGIRGLLRLGRDLAGNNFDIVIDLQNNKKSHILAAMSLAPLRYGYNNGKMSFLLNKKIKDDAPYLDPVDHQARVLGLAGVRQPDKRVELWPSDSDERNVEKFLEENWIKPGQELVGINIRASSRWFTKNWPAANIAELCDRIARDFNIRVVLTGSPGDIDFANYMLKLAKSKPVSAVGRTTLPELACLVRHFSVYLTPDSAPMHVASAVGTPFVALFGPTDYRRHLLKSDRCTVISKSAELGCGPCYRPNCSKKTTCLKKIKLDEVFEAMRPYLTTNSLQQTANRED